MNVEFPCKLFAIQLQRQIRYYQIKYLIFQLFYRIFAKVIRYISYLICYDMTNFDTIALLGKRFKTYRKALHISQRQLHEKTGVSMFTISNFENGKGQGISASHLLSLLNALDLGSSFLELIPDIPAIDPEKMWRKKR